MSRASRPNDPGRALLAADPGVRRHVRRSGIAALPLALLVVAQAYALAAMVVALAQHGRFDGVAAAVLIGTAVARGVLGWWLERAGRRAAAAAIGRLRQELVADAARLAATQPGALRPGEVAADVVTQLPAIESYVGRYLAGGPIARVTTVVVLIAVFVTDPLSAVLLAPTVPLLGLFMWLVGVESGRIADQRLASLQLLGAHLLDVLRGLVDLRAHGRAGFQRSQVRAAATRYREQTMLTLRSAFMSGLVLELIAMLGTALVAVFGGVRLAEGGASLAAILPALVLAPELYAPIRRLGAGYHEAADARAALARLAEVCQAAAKAPLAGRPGGAPAPHVADGSLRLVGVTVAGGEGRADRLQHVDAELPSGTTTALVGPSGAGKSTLAHLVLGLLPPSEGRVLAGHTDLQSVDLGDWHRRAAWVPQDPVLVPGSLRENARLAAPAASDAEVLGALRDAGLSGLVGELPAGLDTPLGEGGSRLSSGELRRLALTRALLSGAELLVLDEPTAQLDALTADHLLATVAELRRGRTTLLITHDPAAAAGADQVLELDGGRIVRTTRTAGFAAPAGGCGRRVPGAAAAWAGWPADGEAAVEIASVVRPSGLSLRMALRLVAPARGADVWQQVWRAIGLGMMSAVAAVAVLALSGALIVQAATQPPVLGLTAVIVTVRLFSILRSLGRYGERLQSHEAALTILESVRVRVFDHVSRHVPGRWSDRSAEALDGAVGDVDRAADLLVRVVVPGAAAIAAVGVAVLVAAVISPVGAAVLLIGALVIGTAVGMLAMQAGRALAEREPARAALAREVVTALDAGPELLLAGRTGDQQARIARQSALLERAAAAHGARGAAVGGVVQLGAAACAAIAAAVLAPAVADGSLGFYAGPFAAALVLGSLAAIERLEGISEAGLALPGATAAVARLAPALLEVGGDDHLAHAPRWMGEPAVLVAEHVAVDRGGRPVLRDASLSVRPGDVVALTGESGAGKSTLLLVLAGLLPASGGCTRLGPRELRAMGDEERATRVVLVPSAPHLFGGSLAANLRLAAPDASDADLRRALGKVGLDAWLQSLPDGLDAMLGEGGATASGGQRQRIGLARAILSPAPIVLLDEPASHLPEADAIAALRAVLRARPGRTGVLVTHRAGERRLATREVRLAGGSASADLALTRQPAHATA